MMNNKFNANDILVIEAYRALDPSLFSEVWNDMFLKKYTMQIIVNTT